MSSRVLIQEQLSITKFIDQKLQMRQYLQNQLKVSQKEFTQQIVYLIGSIRDPERQQTLQELKVVTEHSVKMSYIPIISSLNYIHKKFLIIVNIQITPTVPHCHLTQQIGLAIRMKLNQQLPDNWNKKIKTIIKCKAGSHNNSEEVQKQINDKQRIAGALENQSVVLAIKDLIK